MLVIPLLWAYGYAAPLLLVPPILFLSTNVDEEESHIPVIEEGFFQKILLHNGNLKRMLVHEIVLGWVLAFFLYALLSIQGRDGIGFAMPFLLYLPSQFYHYFNLRTARYNRKKLKKFCLIFTIPAVHISTIGLISSLPAAF